MISQEDSPGASPKNKRRQGAAPVTVSATGADREGGHVGKRRTPLIKSTHPGSKGDDLRSPFRGSCVMPLPKTRWQKLMRGDTLRDVHLLDPRKLAGLCPPGSTGNERFATGLENAISNVRSPGDWSELAQRGRSPFGRYPSGGRRLDTVRSLVGIDPPFLIISPAWWQRVAKPAFERLASRFLGG